MTAEDKDVGEFAKLDYRITHVTSNGKSKFSIDSQSGDIEALGALRHGENYILTVQVTR